MTKLPFNLLSVLRQNQLFTLLLTWTISLCPVLVFAQFALNGSASSLGGSCYRLTPAQNFQVGSAWAPTMVSLNNPFDLQFDIFLGCSNGGADGMVFGLQSVSTTVGVPGGGMGFQGVTPSIGVEFDTWQNTNLGDPFYDHCALILNGDVDHTTTNTLAGPVQINPLNTNVETCDYQRIRIIWDPATQHLEVYWRCSLRLSYTFTTNVVNSVFGGNPNVFWGFTAATGGATNDHRFCIVSNPFQSSVQTDTICEGDSTQLTFTGGYTYQWNTTNGVSNDTIGNPFFSPTSTDTFELTLTDSCGNSWLDTAIIYVQPNFNFSLGNDTLLCPNESLWLNTGLAASDYSFVWSNATTGQSITATSTNNYGVTVTDSLQLCTASDQLDVVVMPQIGLDLGNDSILCDGDQVLLNIQQDSSHYLWFDGSQNSSYLVDSNGLFFVMKFNQCDTLYDSIYYDSIPTIQLELGNDSAMCNGESLTLNAFNDSAIYQWSTGSNADQITVSTSGTYFVTVNTACETQQDSINLIFHPPPTGFLPPDGILCSGDELILSIISADTGFLWSDGSTNDSLTITQPGIYSVTITNFCGVAIDTIELTGLSAPLIDLGEDTSICVGQMVSLDASFASANYQWSNGSGNSTLMINQTGTYVVSVTNFCGQYVDSLSLNVIGTPEITLPNDTSICPEAQLEINPVLTFVDSIIWSTGSEDSILITSEPDKYTVAVFNQCGASSSQIIVSDHVVEPIDIGKDTALCPGNLVPIDVSKNLFDFLWNTGDTSGKVNLVVPGNYSLTVTDVNGCLASDTIELTVNCPWTFYAPNAFSPNGDNRNDVFQPTGINIDDLTLEIYNRWGNLLFESSLEGEGWNGYVDGQLCKQDLYVWKATFNSPDGKVQQEIGEVLLIVR